MTEQQAEQVIKAFIDVYSMALGAWLSGSLDIEFLMGLLAWFTIGAVLLLVHYLIGGDDE